MRKKLENDQQYFMSILQETGFIRLDQVLPLMKIFSPEKESAHVGAMLRFLRYLGLLTCPSEGLICLSELRNEKPERERLLALDMLLALKPAQVLQVSVQPPYQLCFLLQRDDGWVDHFAVVPVLRGQERQTCQLLQADPRDFVFLLLLEDMAQHRQISLSRSHFFVLRQGKNFRFYKGGEAGKRPQKCPDT